MHTKTLIICYAIAILFESCNARQESLDNQDKIAQDESVNSQGLNKVNVEEVIQVRGYTYLQVLENNAKRWLAVPSMEAKIGDTYYYEGGAMMANFESKELQRTFDKILFLPGVSTSPVTVKKENPHDKKPTKAERIKGEVESAKGGITILELMSNKEKYANQEVTIRGVVTKFNQSIMNRNWIHIQDGTGSNDNYDLTITSNDIVSLGETVTVKGVVTLDKDFGYGYNYEVIIENGIVLTEERG